MQRCDLHNGYVVVDVPVGLAGAIHQLYIKEHKGRGSLGDSISSSSTTSAGNKPSNSTLFVGNVDLGLEMSHADIDAYLREMVGQFGKVEAVYISNLSSHAKRHRNRAIDDGQDGSEEGSDEGDGGDGRHEASGLEETRLISTGRSRFAHVVFADRNDMKSFLSAARAGNMTSISRAVGGAFGLNQNWVYHRVSTDKKPDKKDTMTFIKSVRKAHPFKAELSVSELKDRVNRSMSEFEEFEKLEKLRALQAEQEVDEDGFTLVKSRNKRKKSNEDEKKKGGKRKRTKKAAEDLKNFYRFQVREQKRDSLLALREKFAKDQEKIESLKAARKFNPF